MANINAIDRRAIEPFLQMEGGYVLDFNNRTFAEFIQESVGINIESNKYTEEGDSKAKRLRAFFKIEAPSIVAKVLQDLVDYRRYYHIEVNQGTLTDKEDASYKICLKVINDLKNDVSYIDWTHIADESDEDFDRLSKHIQQLINDNQPDIGIDRLHTFTTKYIRKLCDTKGIVTLDKPLHSIFGEYIKYIIEHKYIQSKMSERILKSSISILDAFNDVRNNQSFAHDNKLLSQEESALIFKNVSALLSFIQAIEEKMAPSKPKSISVQIPKTLDDLPF